MPDAFKLWILEWPSRIVIQGLSPFAPLQVQEAEKAVNWIASNPPQILTLVYSPSANEREFEVIPAFLVSRSQSLATWIIFDDRPELFGRVYMSFVGLELADPREVGAIHPDWTTHLSSLWKRQSESYQSNGADKGHRPLSRRSYLGYRLRDMKTPRWTRRHEPRSQEYLHEVGLATAFRPYLCTSDPM